MKRLLTLITIGSMALFGCGGDDSDGGSGSGSNNGQPAGSVSGCMTASDCPEAHACIQIGNGPAGCVPTCSAMVDACGGSAQCAGVGALDVNICQEEKPEPDPEDPPTPEEEPRIPCREDAECSELHPDAICAEWRGQRDCTIPCMNEEVCDPPAIAGITVDFMDCQDDQRSDKTRTACLPREECFNNPLDCISGFPGLGGDLPGEGDFPGAGDLPDGF